MFQHREETHALNRQRCIFADIPNWMHVSINLSDETPSGFFHDPDHRYMPRPFRGQCRSGTSSNSGRKHTNIRSLSKRFETWLSTHMHAIGLVNGKEEQRHAGLPAFKNRANEATMVLVAPKIARTKPPRAQQPVKQNARTKPLLPEWQPVEVEGETKTVKTKPPAGMAVNLRKAIASRTPGTIVSPPTALHGKKLSACVREHESGLTHPEIHQDHDEPTGNATIGKIDGFPKSRV